MPHHRISPRHLKVVERDPLAPSPDMAAKAAEILLLNQEREMRAMIAMIYIGCMLERPMSCWEIDAALRRVKLGQGASEIATFIQNHQAT